MAGVICVHIGSCGISLGDMFFNVISHEHGLTPSGHFVGNTLAQLARAPVYYTLGRRIYGKAILVDTDPALITRRFPTDNYRNMFAPYNMITSPGEGTGNNYGKGYNTEGKAILEPTLDAIRHEAERSNSIQGFQITHSIGGGTGSGFFSLLTEDLIVEYPKSLMCTWSVIPSSGMAIGPVEPYNALLAFRHLLANTNITHIIDNEAIANISTNILHAVPSISGDMNSIIAYTMAAITSGLRFPGQLNTSLRQIYTNMCPYPNLHFLASGYAPIIPCRSVPYTKINVDELINPMFTTKNYLCSIDLRNEKILTMAAMFRGALSPGQIHSKLRKTTAKHIDLFANWVPNSTKWSLCEFAPLLMPKCVGFLCNSTSVVGPIERVQKNANMMLKRKAYLHWFTGEGMELADFQNANNSLLELVKEYKETRKDAEIKTLKDICPAIDDPNRNKSESD